MASAPAAAAATMDDLLKRHAQDERFTLGRIAQLAKPKLGQKPLSKEALEAQSAKLLGDMRARHEAEVAALTERLASAALSPPAPAQGEASAGSTAAGASSAGDTDTAPAAATPAAPSVPASAAPAPGASAAPAPAPAAAAAAAPPPPAEEEDAGGRKKSRAQRRKVRVGGRLGDAREGATPLRPRAAAGGM